MEITTANLTALFTGFDVIFQRGFDKPPSYYEKIATVVRSASRQTTYPVAGADDASFANGWASE